MLCCCASLFFVGVLDLWLSWVFDFAGRVVGLFTCGFVVCVCGLLFGSFL